MKFGMRVGIGVGIKTQLASQHPAQPTFQSTSYARENQSQNHLHMMNMLQVEKPVNQVYYPPQNQGVWNQSYVPGQQTPNNAQV